MCRSTTQSFIVDVFTDSRFNQVRSSQKDGAGLVNDHSLIAHNRKICATGSTTTHNGGNLNDAHRRHLCIVPELTPEMFFVRKNFILHWKKNTGTIHEI